MPGQTVYAPQRNGDMLISTVRYVMVSKHGTDYILDGYTRTWNEELLHADAESAQKSTPSQQ